jgi:hypothetical protein
MAGFTTEHLDALEEAIALGAKRVKYGDREVEYQTQQEMLTLRDRMKRELGQTSKSRGRRIYFTTSKGLDGGC